MKSCNMFQFPQANICVWVFDKFKEYFSPQNISTITNFFMKIVKKIKMTISSKTSRGPVQLMPGPGNISRPGGWETLL